MKIFLHFLLILNFVGCGSEPQGIRDTREVKPTGKAKTELFNKLKKEISSFKVSCDSEICPRDIVLLGGIDAKTGEFQYCNGLNLGEGKVLTVSSCLPDNIARGSIFCGENLLLKTNSGKVHECLKPISYEVDKFRLEDWPETWLRDYIVLEFDGLKDKQVSSFAPEIGINEGLHFLWSYNVDVEKRTAVLEKSVCSIIYHNYLQPLANHYYSPNFSLVNCNRDDLFKTTQSYGALLSQTRSINSKFKLLGMLISGIPDRLNREVSELNDIFPNEIKDYIQGGFVNNFSCWSDLYTEEEKRPLECFAKMGAELEDEITYERDIMINLEDNASSNFEEYIANFEKYYEDEDLYMRWGANVVSEKLNYHINPRTVCFHNTDDWLGRIRDKEIEYTKKLKSFSLYPNFDRKMKINAILREGTLNYRLKLSAKDLKKKSRSDIEVEVTSQSGSTLSRYKLKDVRICP